MKKSIVRKGIVLGIIVLFVGASVLPSMGGTIVEKQISKENKTSLMGFNPHGTTWYVGGSGPNNYSTIQEGINAASDGDTVFVYDDSSPYYENIEVYKSINLIGENRDTTIIDGGGSGDVVNITVDLVYISGFTIQNSGNGGYPYYYAGIDIRSISNTITGNTIISNNGYGIRLYYSNGNTITGNTIISNNDDGIILKGSKNNNITGNTIISDNVCGISLYYSSSNTIIGNNITNNAFGMLLWGRSNTVTGNNISSNDFGGIWLLYASSNTVKENTITSNNRYGIYLSSESSRNIINGNTISNNDDGISLRYLSHRNTITGNIISNNVCGINLSSSFNGILKNNFLNNERHAFFSSSFSFNLKNNSNNNERRVFLYIAFRNHWLRNYWEGDKSLPVRINGMQSFYITDRLDDIIWEHHIPWINFDYLPAQEPYAI